MYCSCCDEEITDNYIAVYGRIYCEACYENTSAEDLVDDLNLSTDDLLYALDGYKSNIQDEIDDFKYREEVGK